MKKTGSVLLTLSLLASLVWGRKTFLVKEEHPSVLAPRVQTFDSYWTLFNWNNYQLILDNQIELDVGWDFKQRQGYYGSYSFRQWAFRNDYYVLFDFVLHPELTLSNYY